MNRFTRRALLGALAAAVLLTTGCGTRVEQAAILAAEGHSASAPGGDSAAGGGVATGADALLVVTEWDEFRQLDLDRIKSLMRRPVIVDGRNIFDPKSMRERGFVYRGVGRS